MNIIMGIPYYYENALPMKMRKNSAFLVPFAILIVISLVISLVLPILTAFSYTSIHKAHVTTENGLSTIGDQPSEQFGASLAKGDVNGDGVEDLLVGSPFYSSEKAVWTGKVSVYFGWTGSDNKETTGDDTTGLTGSEESTGVSLGTPDLVFYGKESSEHLGISVATGDFNNDGFDDLLMGAYKSLSDIKKTGRAYLMLGRESFKKVEYSFATQKADFEFIGKRDGDGFGISVKLVDINGDNYDDVLVGAPFALSIGDVSAGNVYAYFGKGYRVDRVYYNNSMFHDRDASAVFWGQNAGERFGASIAVGDFVGSEESDVAIAAYFAEGPNGPQSGRVYLYKGPAGNLKNFYQPYDVLVGSESYSWFGFSISNAGIGERDSLLISSFPFARPALRGKAYLLEGREWFVNPFDKEAKNGDSGVADGMNIAEGTDASEEPQDDFYVVDENSSDYYFEGTDTQSLLGASHGVGDFDNDGKNDLFIGAPGVSYTKSDTAGEVYFFYGDTLADGGSFSLEERAVTGILYGDRPDDWFGARTVALDFNGDGYDDLAVSSRYADVFDEDGLIAGSNHGAVYILFGGENIWGKEVVMKQASDNYISRGEFIKEVVDRFDIKDTRKSYLDSCYSHRDFCFYVFSSQSKFEGIQLDPEIILYPDVPADSEFYDAITTASMLGVVSGYAGEEDTPFRPNDNITRIQALKVILGINQLVKPAYRFELINQLGGMSALENQQSMFSDITPKVTSMWWYPMYANFAYEHGLSDVDLPFRPDDNLTKGELRELIDRTLEFIQNG